MKTDFYPKLDEYLLTVLKDINQIPASRKEILDTLSGYIQKKKQAGESVKLNFICTHNSRRSHMGQLWAQAVANYYGLGNVHTFSGGTEATAFNPRAVAAMERAGFKINQGIGGDNPKYEVSFGKEAPRMVVYSKKYNDTMNPSAGFAAILTCSDVDEACPIVQGAEARIPLHYEDPKDYDDTDQETQKYDERSRQIAIEMFYVMSSVNSDSR